MSTHQYATLGDTVYFYFNTNDTSGSAGDATTPLFDVRLAGAAAGAAPVLSGTPTLLTHANYQPGAYEVAIAATTGNGFAAGSVYAVFATATIDSQTPGEFIGSFALSTLLDGPDVGMLVETTIATLASQTSFTLTAGSDTDTDYVGHVMVIEDADDTTRRSSVYATAYTGSSKTVALAAGTNFTAAVGDKVRVYAAIHPEYFANNKALTESYAADGAEGTMAQILYAIQQMLQEFNKSGTTISIKKLDGSTEAYTLTLDDADAPLTISRST